MRLSGLLSWEGHKAGGRFQTGKLKTAPAWAACNQAVSDGRMPHVLIQLRT